MKRILTIALAAIAVSCTSYGDMGLAGGVSDRQIGERMWDIRSNGSAFANLTQIEDYIYLRAAEIGRAYGFSHFTPLSEASGYEEHLYTDNTETFSTTTDCYGRSCKTEGTVTGPSTSSYRTPHADARILFFTPAEYDDLPPEERVYMMSVDAIWNDLAPRYIPETREG